MNPSALKAGMIGEVLSASFVDDPRPLKFLSDFKNHDQKQADTRSEASGDQRIFSIGKIINEF